MHTRYCLLFLFLAILISLAAVVLEREIGLSALLLFYPACSSVLLAVAHGGWGPGIFQKRADGLFPPSIWLLLGPYLLANEVLFLVYCQVNRERASVEVSPNLYFGRRLTTREARQARSAGIIAVLDLACEFMALRPFRDAPGYRSFPILDLTAPSDAQLEDALRWIAQSLKSGPVFVHCAAGHGRSACVVLAHLLRTGAIPNVAAGLKHLRSLRPGVSLTIQQTELLWRLEKAHAETLIDSLSGRRGHVPPGGAFQDRGTDRI